MLHLVLDRPSSEPYESRADRMDPGMAEVLRAKTGTERMQMAFAMYRAARRMIASQLRADHPDWDPEAVDREVARRIAGGSR